MSEGDPLRIFCPAKVNLFLEVHGRRPDGFHEIVTVLQAVDLSDTLDVSRADSEISLAVTGADLPTGPGNLAYDAAASFLGAFSPGRGVEIRLVKRIPDRAGLGGGSSDAAGALLALRDLYRPELPLEELDPLAAALGSDVPFFLRGGIAVARGRGERLESVPSPSPDWLVLFLPPFGLSTADVYGRVRVPDAVDLREPGPLLDALGEGRRDVGLYNRLEAAAAEVEPRLTSTRLAIEERLAPEESLLLSGSGSVFFTIVGGFGRAAELAAEWNRSGDGRALAVRTRPA